MNRSYSYVALTDFPAECLYDIFLYLKNDNASLFNCLMVNRNWCRQAIPLLWRKPFRDHSNVTMPYLLIRTYLSCLFDNAKKRLNAAGCRHRTLLSNPLFPYPSYLRELDFAELDNALDIWLIYGLEYEYEPPTLRHVLSSEVYKLLFTHCKSLWNLKIGQYDDDYTIMDIAQVAKAPQTLSTLRQFELCGDFDCLEHEDIDNLSNILTTMSHFSLNLQHLKINLTSDEDKCLLKRLRRLIRAQSSLKSFIYSQELGCVMDTKSVMTALTTQSKNLENLVLDVVPLNMTCLKFLEQFSNLKTIRFIYCYIKSDEVSYCKDTGKLLDIVPDENDVEGNGEESWKLNVEKLVFLKNNFRLMTINLVKIAHSSLKELTIDHATVELLTEITHRCVNLVYLAIGISRIPVDELYKISSMKLEVLAIGWSLSNKENTEDLVNIELTNEECKKLGKFLPSSLRHLHIDFPMTPPQLDTVLCNCVMPPVISLKFSLLNFEKCAEVVFKCVKDVYGFQEVKITKLPKNASIMDMMLWERNFFHMVELGRMDGIKVGVEREEPFGIQH
ncbi:11454_t:CDS:1 [Dentiscutata erythropus]|uniref:11454_t:CDS:1 n=1 Tax=Dentiscutata erythropus TaxID=1348616 RepID=A0A9N9DCS1_9GLOM|nr:11454_t:CDS:1 [Dentiscutata erythropus]